MLTVQLQNVGSSSSHAEGVQTLATGNYSSYAVGYSSNNKGGNP